MKAKAPCDEEQRLWVEPHPALREAAAPITQRRYRYTAWFQRLSAHCRRSVAGHYSGVQQSGRPLAPEELAALSRQGRELLPRNGCS